LIISDRGYLLFFDRIYRIDMILLKFLDEAFKEKPGFAGDPYMFICFILSFLSILSDFKGLNSLTGFIPVK